MVLSVSLARMEGGGGGSRITQVIARLGSNIETNADRLGEDMIGRWKKYTYEGWPLGPDRPGHIHSRDTIEEPQKLGQGHYQFRVTAPYAGIIEYGGYRRVGPKTAREGGTTLPGNVNIGAGIYPIQRPYAPLRRAESRMKLEMAQQLAPQIMRASGFGGFGGRGTSTAFRGGA